MFIKKWTPYTAQLSVSDVSIKYTWLSDEATDAPYHLTKQLGLTGLNYQIKLLNCMNSDPDNCCT